MAGANPNTSNGQITAISLPGDERRLIESLYEYSPLFVSVHHGPELNCVFANLKMRSLFRERPPLGRTAVSFLKELEISECDQKLLHEWMSEVFRTGAPIHDKRFRSSSATDQAAGARILRAEIAPAFRGDGSRTGVLLSFFAEPERVQEEGSIGAESELGLVLKAIEAADMGSFDCDLVRNVVRVSRRCLELHGIDARSKRPDEGWKIEDFLARIHPDDVERVRAEISETDQLRKPEFKFDLRIATPQGEDRWLAVRERRSYDSEGNPVRSFGVCWDKTQEKQMELGLRASEERLRAFHENVAVGLIEIDLKNFRYLNANRAFCEMFGYEEKELLRMGPLDLAGPRDVDVIRQSLEDIASERKTVHKAERQYRRRSGELLWVQIVASAIRDEAGRPVRLACIIQDISERKKIEQALRESDQRYQLATALTGITVFEIDLESRMAYSSDFKNEPFNAPNGVLPLEKVYEKVHFEDRFPGNQVEHWQSARKDEIFVNESRVIVPGGGYRWNSSRARVIFDDNGKAVRVLGVSMDITRQKQLLHDLQAAKEQAERASNAKSEFIANMSHEIRTPMNAILGYADLLKDEQLRLKDIESYIERIRHNGKQLLRIIDDVLDFSRLEAGRVAVEPMPVQVLSLVSEAMESLRSLAEAKKLAFTLEQASAIPMVLTTDPFRLKQILTNVIGNAIKFTARGFVRVKLASDEPAQGSLIIDVEDSGIGIDQEKRSRLFHAFSQGDSSVTRVFGGTGLGLLLAKRFAQALGGDLILAASEPRQGSTFRITVKSLILPVMDHVEPSQTETAATVNRETDTATKPAKSTAASLEGLRILVVEDSAENAALIRIYLKGQGAVLEFAQDGVEAIEMASQGEHDVVLMDIQMPRLDGLEATRELIRKGYHQPIVALTAHAMPDQIQRSLDAGCVAHLTKPIQREDLIAAIRRIVDSTRGALSSGT